MRTPEPNYSAYSLAQLHDAARHIDADRLPERAARLNAEIEAREALAAEESRILEASGASAIDQGRRRDAAFQAVGACLTGSGSLTLLSAIGTVRSASTTAEIAIYGFMCCMFLGMVVGGVLLLLKSQLGFWVSSVVLILQLPFVVIGKFVYTVAPLPAAELKIWPRFGPYIAADFNFMLLWTHEPQSFYFGLNLFAAVMLCVLVAFGRRLAN